MKTRIISGLIMAPVVIAVIYFGSLPLLIGCFVISLIGLREFYGAFQKGTAKTKYPVRPYYMAGFLLTALLYAFLAATASWPHYGTLWLDGAENNVSEGGWFLRGFAVLFLITLVLLLRAFKAASKDTEDFLSWYFRHTGNKIQRIKEEAPERWARRYAGADLTLLGFLYIPFLIAHIILLDRLTLYSSLIWFVFIAAFGTDVAAYFTGYVFGKHKLAPTISPKKTIEGSVGGILGSAVISGVFAWFFMPALLNHCILIGLLGSVFAQIGDLTASVFKRKVGIKDYGDLIPGHGGVLDRFDSILFTAPFVYYYTVLVMAL